jgi:hypothetical protein
MASLSEVFPNFKQQIEFEGFDGNVDSDSEDYIFPLLECPDCGEDGGENKMNNSLKLACKVIYGTGIVGCAIHRANEFTQEKVDFNRYYRNDRFKDVGSSATLGLMVGIGEGLILPLTLVSTLTALPTIIKNYLS